MYTHISIGRRKPVGLNARVLYENDSLHSQEYMTENSASIVILNNTWFGLKNCQTGCLLSFIELSETLTWNMNSL